MTPLRFANPSPPSGWIEDFHLQAVGHARHTTKEQGRGPAQNETIPIRPNLLELLDRDFQRLEAPFGEVLPRLGPRGGTERAVRLPRMWRLFDIAAFCHYNFELWPSIILRAKVNLLAAALPKALLALVFWPMIRLHSGTHFPPILKARHAVIALLFATFA
jgi:hypothetical protein